MPTYGQFCFMLGNSCTAVVSELSLRRNLPREVIRTQFYSDLNRYGRELERLLGFDGTADWAVRAQELPLQLLVVNQAFLSFVVGDQPLSSDFLFTVWGVIQVFFRDELRNLQSILDARPSVN